MRYIYKMLLSVLVVVIGFGIAVSTSSADENNKKMAGEGAPPSEEKVWNAARSEIMKFVHSAGRSEVDLEQPEWYASGYSTLGRMPLVDVAMEHPLQLPEIARHFDAQAKQHGDSLRKLFVTADQMSNAASGNDYPEITIENIKARPIPEDIKAVIEKISKLESLPEKVRDGLSVMTRGIAISNVLREEALKNFSKEERERLAKALPAFFLREKKDGTREFQAYTCETGPNEEAYFLVQKINWEKMIEAAVVLSTCADYSLPLLQNFQSEKMAASPDIILDEKTKCGRIIIGNVRKNTYREDAALIVDFGGDDLYLNNSGGTHPTGLGASAVIDLGGNDSYRGVDFAQGCGFGGVGMLVDFSGNDSYTSEYYSQGAALAGFAFFLEGDGEDTYTGDLGVQCFSMFGYSVFSERSGNDSYRCQTMGQGFATTLGVSLFRENSGNDTYVGGGKYGFYTKDDSGSCQGAASGVRPWPADNRFSFYGGVTLFSDFSGNDIYTGSSFSQGGSYVLSLAMFVDSSGDDSYRGADYAQGSGCHLSSAVCIDREGNDTYVSNNHSTGGSLDRSAGVFLDLRGNDKYTSPAGIGYAGKPRGIGIFVDADGNDSYSAGVYGKARSPYSEDTQSTAVFLDFSGNDEYDKKMYSNDKQWKQNQWGFGKDFKTPPTVKNSEGKIPWTPIPVKQTNIFPSPSTLVRMQQSGELLSQEKFTDELLKAANGKLVFPLAQKEISLWLEFKRLKKALTPKMLDDLRSLLAHPNPDVRLAVLTPCIRGAKPGEEFFKTLSQQIAKENDVRVKSIAVLVLATSKDAIYIKVLAEILKNDISPVVRRRTAIALRQFAGNSEAEKILIDAIKREGDFRVKTQLVNSLGAFANEKNQGLFNSLIGDRSEFVRLAASKILIVRYFSPRGVEGLVKLLKWENEIMVAEDVTKNLSLLTGVSYGKPKEWQTWWKMEGSTIDVKQLMEVSQTIMKADALFNSDKRTEAITLLDNVYKTNTGHQLLKSKLASYLNDEAWSYAKSGKDLEKGLELAKRSVDLLPNNPAFLDTLSGLYFLMKNKDEAIKTIQKAIDLAPKEAKPLYMKRLKEYETGKTNIE